MRKIVFTMDGDQISAVWDYFDCLAVSPAGFGDTLSAAFANLINETESNELNLIIASIENGNGA